MKKVFAVLTVLLSLALVSYASAQITYSNGWFTSYSVVNLSPTNNANIVVTYYDTSGSPASYSPTFTDVPPYSSVTVQQALEPSLPSGRYSAVISSSEPIAAVANQQLGNAGNGTSIAPFSSYSGFDGGATSVTLPSIMHNWYGYYTEIFIQNLGTSDATDVLITYEPTTMGSCVTGNTGQTDTPGTIAPNASAYVSQYGKSSLGAPSVSGCTSYTGRFLGSAKVTSTQPIAIVVNQITQDKLFTYNGFTENSTQLVAPAYMRNWYGYYASLTIANPDTIDANVVLTYTSSADANPPNTVVTATHTIPAGKSINRYDGPGATTDQSDIEVLFPQPGSNKFFGSVTIASTNGVPIVAMVNQEAIASKTNQAGTYNVFTTSEGSTKIAVPLIQSAFYGYYTSLTIMTVDGQEATVNITYTSDGTFSTVKNHSETYTYTTTNGFLNRYEGPGALGTQSDILDDLAWYSGGQRRFLGSAIIEVTSGSNIVAYVNSESLTAPYATTRDSMYTYNAINITP